MPTEVITAQIPLCPSRHDTTRHVYWRCVVPTALEMGDKRLRPTYLLFMQWVVRHFVPAVNKQVRLKVIELLMCSVMYTVIKTLVSTYTHCLARIEILCSVLSLCCSVFCHQIGIYGYVTYHTDKRCWTDIILPCSPYSYYYQ